jgi:hypothetical protein
VTPACAATMEYRATLRDAEGREARVLGAAMPGRGGTSAAYLTVTVPPVLGVAMARELAATLQRLADDVERAHALNCRAGA